MKASDNLKVPAGGTIPAATAASPSEPATTAVAGLLYTVETGDYLIDIAAKRGVTLKALLAANGLIASSVIIPGRQLVLPPSTPWSRSSERNSASHTSRTGQPVDWRAEAIRAGDLVFAFSTGKNYISHVGVAISSTQWISSSQTGVPVKIGALPGADRIQVVRRIVPGA